RQERPGRACWCRPADAADGKDHGRRNRRMSDEKVVGEQKEGAIGKAASWRAQAVQLAAIVAVVFVAKGALAEPFYVPSGSMEPARRKTIAATPNGPIASSRRCRTASATRSSRCGTMEGSTTRPR